MITKSYRNHNTKITFEQIFWHALDQHTSGKDLDIRDVTITLDRIEGAIFNLIKRKGFIDELLVDLGLSKSRHERKNHRIAAAK